MVYVSKERVERGGRLIAFAGESMPHAEAVRRGLIKKATPKPTPQPDAAPLPVPQGRRVAPRSAPDLSTVKTIQVYAAEHGIDLSGCTRKADMIARILAAED